MESSGWEKIDKSVRKGWEKIDENARKGWEKIDRFVWRFLYGRPFGRIFNEAQVEEWADKMRQETPKAELLAIREDIEKGAVRCHHAEDDLKMCFRINNRGWQYDPNFHPIKSGITCGNRILELSECLRMCGRRPRSDPDKIYFV